MVQDAALAAKRKMGRGKNAGDIRIHFPQERYEGVRDFWAKLTHDQRAQLMLVPVLKLLHGAETFSTSMRGVVDGSH